MIGRRRSRKKFQCGMGTTCWNRVTVEGRLCTACSAWWYRIVLKDAEDLALYVRKVNRYAGRLGSIANLRAAHEHKSRPKIRRIAAA